MQRRGHKDYTPRRPLQAAGNRLKGFLRHLGASIPLLSETQRDEASGKLVEAGYRSTQALLILGGITFVTVISLLAIVIFYGRSLLNEGGVLYWVIALAGSIYLGSLLPRMVLDVLVKRRQEAIRIALPDALDLLVITTNAGLGLNAALDRVADEMLAVAPELADELKLTALQLRVSSDVEAVLNGLAKRTNIESMHSLVSTFVQARQYGTPITQALRVLARSERTARMLRLEEQAAKLAVKITLPLMLFILPTVLIVAAGPAILNIIETFSNL